MGRVKQFLYDLDEIIFDQLTANGECNVSEVAELIVEKYPQIKNSEDLLQIIDERIEIVKEDYDF